MAKRRQLFPGSGQDSKDRFLTSCIIWGLVVGLLLGALIGALSGAVGFGIGIGMAVGIVVGVVYFFSRQGRYRSRNDQDAGTGRGD